MTRVMVDKYRAEIADFLAPARCHWCGARCADVACASCAAALPWNAPACRCCALPLGFSSSLSACNACLSDAPPQDRAWAAFRYEAPVAEGIRELKFHARLAPAHVLGRLMAQRLAARAEPLPELLVPVPLHDARLRRRGYNQALEISRELARRLSLRVLPHAARRSRPTLEQTRLDAAERRRNVRGAFTVEEDALRNRHVALLDDVITTGATLAELARAARAAGARRIEVWAAARVA